MAGRTPGRKKGSRKTGGRRKGTPNKATTAIAEACRKIVDQPTYQRQLADRARQGKLPPAVECMVWHSRTGKPVERHELDAAVVGGTVDLDAVKHMKTEELEQLCDLLRRVLGISGDESPETGAQAASPVASRC